LQLSKVDKRSLAVTGWTKYNDLKNLTKSIVIEELDLLKQDFNNLVSATNELKDFIKDKTIEYNLVMILGKLALESARRRANKLFG